MESKEWLKAAKLAFSTGDNEKARRLVKKSLELRFSQEALGKILLFAIR